MLSDFSNLRNENQNGIFRKLTGLFTYIRDEESDYMKIREFINIFMEEKYYELLLTPKNIILFSKCICEIFKYYSPNIPFNNVKDMYICFDIVLSCFYCLTDKSGQFYNDVISLSEIVFYTKLYVLFPEYLILKYMNIFVKCDLNYITCLISEIIGSNDLSIYDFISLNKYMNDTLKQALNTLNSKYKMKLYSQIDVLNMDQRKILEEMIGNYSHKNNNALISRNTNDQLSEHEGLISLEFTNNINEFSEVLSMSNNINSKIREKVLNVIELSLERGNVEMRTMALEVLQKMLVDKNNTIRQNVLRIYYKNDFISEKSLDVIVERIFDKDLRVAILATEVLKKYYKKIDAKLYSKIIDACVRSKYHFYLVQFLVRNIGINFLNNFECIDFYKKYLIIYNQEFDHRDIAESNNKKTAKIVFTIHKHLIYKCIEDDIFTENVLYTLNYIDVKKDLHNKIKTYLEMNKPIEHIVLMTKYLKNIPLDMNKINFKNLIKCHINRNDCSILKQFEEETFSNKKVLKWVIKAFIYFGRDSIDIIDIKKYIYYYIKAEHNPKQVIKNFPLVDKYVQQKCKYYCAKKIYKPYYAIMFILIGKYDNNEDVHKYINVIKPISSEILKCIDSGYYNKKHVKLIKKTLT